MLMEQPPKIVVAEPVAVEVQQQQQRQEDVKQRQQQQKAPVAAPVAYDGPLTREEVKYEFEGEVGRIPHSVLGYTSERFHAQDPTGQKLAPLKKDLPAKTAVWVDKQGRSYHDASGQLYAQKEIEQIMSQYKGKTWSYAFYWVKLPPNSVDFPSSGEYIQVRSAKGKEFQYAKVQEAQDKIIHASGPRGTRGTAWVVLSLAS